MRVVEPPLSVEQLPPLLTAEDFSVGTGRRVPANDPRLSALLAGASAAIRNYCGWHIAPVIEDDYTLDYDGGSLLVLRTLRLVDVLALTVRDQTLDPETIEWSANGEINLLGHYEPPGWRCPAFRGVQIKVQHGFDLDAVADLKQVVQQVVGNAISSPLGATREQAGAVSVSWATTAPGVSGGLSLLERDLMILDRYKLPRGA